MNKTDKMSSIKKPDGIMHDIRNNETCSSYYNRNMFRFMDTNKTCTEIPQDILAEYVTELNYNYQTPLMFAVILKNKYFVEQLILHDAGCIDSFGNSALIYANLILHETDISSNEYNTVQSIIDIISEYEHYYDRHT